MPLGQNGIVYIGTRTQGKAYALIPNKKLSRAKSAITIAKDLNAPNGVAYHHGY